MLAWEGRCIYLVGDFESAEVNKGLREVFSTEIQPEGQSRKLGFFKLYYSPDAWSLRLEEIFGSLLDHDVERRIYCSVRDSPSRIAVPSPPLELRQIDAQLLQSDFAHIDLVRDEILGCWPSFETFLDQGFGFTMLDGTSVVCWCTAEYVSEGKCGIGIETIEAYQGRGIATAVAGEFVRHALASGVRIPTGTVGQGTHHRSGWQKRWGSPTCTTTRSQLAHPATDRGSHDIPNGAYR